MLETRWPGETSTPFAFSRALIEFVAWRGEDEPEEGADEATAGAALDLALKANPYVGIFLANMSVFVRELDPAKSAEAV